MIIATAGHVDHGKTQLVHAITGIQTDRLEEEQRRGLTIDLGFAYTDLNEQRIGFVDVPGHIRFIHNMLAGISAVDFALLVVAADDGPMPQTREHLAILNLLGVNRGAVALTKIDRVSEERVTEVIESINSLVAGTGLEGASVMPVSSVTGAGIDTLVELLTNEASNTTSRTSAGEFRLAIDRRFTVRGAGIVVTGSVFSGRIETGDEALLLPEGIPVRVKGIRRQDEDATTGQTGDRCAINITAPGLSLNQIKRGQWLTTSPADKTDRVDAYVSVLPESRALRNWTPVHVHSGSSHLTARVATLTGSAVHPGDSGLVQLVLTEPGTFWAGDRIIIREQSAESTLGGGFVIDPYGPRRGRARPERLALLEAMRTNSPRQRLEAMLQTSDTGISSHRFAQASGLKPGEVDEILKTLDVRCANDLVLAPAKFDSLQQAVLEALERWHAENTGATGAAERQLRTELGSKLSEDLWQAVVNELIVKGKVIKAGSRYQLPDHKPELSPAEENFWSRVEGYLAENVTRPPVMHDLAKMTNLPPAAVEKMLGRYVELGMLVRPASNRFFLPHGMRQLERIAVSAAESNSDGTFTVKEFRDLTGIGRNLSIEVLEYFDRRGVTVRMGDKRKLGRSAPAKLE